MLSTTNAFWRSYRLLVVGLTLAVAGAVLAAQQPVSQSGTWNVNNISGTVTLPTLAATSTKQSDGSQKTQIVDGSGNVIAATSNNLNVQCANCSGSGVSAADEATFTAGTSVFAAGGGFFQTTATNNALTTGQQGAFQLTANRALFTNLRNASGTEIGTSGAPVRVDPTGTTTQPVQGAKTNNTAAPGATNVGALGYIANAAAQAWTEGNLVLGSVDLHGSQRVTILDASGAAVTPDTQVTHDGALTPASTTGGATFYRASSSAPSAVSTNDDAVLAWADTNGRLHVTGDASMGKLLVTPDSVALPANQSVNVAQVAGATTSTAASGVQKVGIVGNAGAAVDAATGAAPPANALLLAGLVGGATGGFLQAVPVCESQAFLNMTTATTTEIVPLTSGRTVHICHFRLLANGTTTATFKRGTGSNCGTGTTAIDADYNLTAQVGFSAGSGFGEVLSGSTAANAVCVTNSAAVNLQIFVRYAVY